jgi:hypothetical protein
MAKSQDVDTTVSGTVTNRPIALDQFHQLMRDRAGMVREDRGAEVMQRQALAILQAESVEDIINADMGGTIQARDVDGLEIEILDFEPLLSNRTDSETGRQLAREGYYVSMNAVVLGATKDQLTRFGLQLGKEIVLQTGAELFMLKVAALEKAGALPFRGRVTAIETQSGNSVVKLFPLPERATQSPEPPF